MKLFNHFDLLIILLVFSVSIDHPNRGLPYDDGDCGIWSNVIRPVKAPFLECVHRKTGVKYSYRIFN